MDYAYISRRDKSFITDKMKNEYIMPRRGYPQGAIFTVASPTGHFALYTQWVDRKLLPLRGMIPIMC